MFRNRYFLSAFMVVIVTAIIFIKPTREAMLKLYGSFVTVAGIPNELIVPIFLNEYKYGDQVTINYGPRDGLATNVQATLNGVFVASGERVTLTKSGENIIIFSGTKTSDGQSVSTSQTFNVIGTSLPSPTPSIGTGGGSGSGGGGGPIVTDTPVEIIASAAKKEYNLGDRITVSYKPCCQFGFIRTFDLEARLNGNQVSNNTKPILTKPGRNVLTYSGKKTLGGGKINLEYVFHVLTSLSYYGLHEGDVIGARSSGDPDLFIVNDYGFKRLFLNPEIFNFYGHLGGFRNVKNITPETRDDFVTSGLFSNCEAEGKEAKKVYALEVTEEDGGVLHWINIEEKEAVKEDPNLLKKVFCINNNEFNWYTERGTKFGSEYTTMKEIPSYQRSK